MFTDYHVHTYYSDDSIYPMEDVIKDAIEIGLDEIVITDHVDFGVKIDWKDEQFDPYLKEVRNVHFLAFFDEINKLKLKYKDDIVVKVGMEFGMQMHTINQFQDLFNSHKFDFILLSIHQIGNKEFWTGEFKKGKSIEESYDKYYEEMLNLVKYYKDYSVLAHLDLIRRYLDKENDMFEYSKDDITEILKVVIADRKGIEVNTSNDRYGINGLTPSIEILKLYYELGGRIITIGSDSHKKEHLAYKIEESKQILREIGFKHFCTFDSMEPIFHIL